MHRATKIEIFQNFQQFFCCRTLSKSGHVKGLYRTMSELIPNIGQRSFPPLRMVSIMPNAPMKSDDQVRDIISWLKGVWIPPPITHTKTTAKHIITDEGLRTHVLGFMDYDPKSAAIASKNAHRKRGRTSKWFDF
eukprot:gene9543-19838_t